MYNTLDEAINALNSINSTGEVLKSDLMSLVEQVSIHAGGDTTVLYSGKVDSVYSGDIVKINYEN